MTHEAYSTKKVTVWNEERDGVPGKAIKYKDGYRSWCPDTVYERDYASLGQMSFGHALHALEEGHRVARAGWNGWNGWNGKGMWLKMVAGQDYWVRLGNIATLAPGQPSRFSALPWIGMKTADGGFVPWLCSQTDMLAHDWTIVEG